MCCQSGRWLVVFQQEMICTTASLLPVAVAGLGRLLINSFVEAKPCVFITQTPPPSTKTSGWAEASALRKSQQGYLMLTSSLKRAIRKHGHSLCPGTKGLARHFLSSLLSVGCTRLVTIGSLQPQLPVL